MIITQPDRVMLHEQVMKYAPRLSGELLDVGAGRARRYADLCPNVTSYRTLDTDTGWQPDIVASAEDIPLPDESVDAILCTQVLEHVAHPQKVIGEFHRILRQGGTCLLTVPQWNELHEEPHDYFRYTSFGLRTLFEDAGFRIDIMEPRGKYFSMKAQLTIRYLIDRWQPYRRRPVMWILGPLSMLLAGWGMWRDRVTTHPAAAKHVIGWCVVAQKT